MPARAFPAAPVYTANLSSGTAAAHFAAGRRASTDTTTALSTRTNYDGLGRQVDTWSPALATFLGGLQAPTRTHAVFDRLGHQTETWLNYAYDEASRPTGITP